MAQLTQAEFNAAVAALAQHLGVERLRDHLARMNAFTSRRGLNTAAAIAERLHLLTGGLRRQVAGTYAFSSLWGEMIAKRVGEEGEKRLEKLADAVNACLAPDEGQGQQTGRSRWIDAVGGERLNTPRRGGDGQDSHELGADERILR